VVVAAQFMVVLDVAIVNVALPSIKTDLNFSQESLQWVITAYAIFFGGALLLGGRLADLLGRRRLFVAGLVLFTVSSLLDGLAWSEGSLIAFRSLQGLGAAMLSPAALSILTTTFAEGRERNLALGIWGAASGSGGAAGVLLGGALTSAFSWSWIFFINVPAGLIVLASVPFVLRESRANLDHRHFDTAGAASITGGLMLLVYAMTRAAQHGWINPETIGLLAASAALIVGFVLIELRSKAPLLPLRIFRLRTLTASNVSGLLLAAAVFSQFFLLTLYMQQVLHYSALKTGVAYVALTLSIIAFSGIAQALTTRVGVRPVLTGGLALSAGGLVLYAQLPVGGHYFWDLFPAFMLSGIGLALAFVSMSIGALTGTDQSDAGVASGLINTSQQIGGAIGVAAATTIATTFTTRYVNAHSGVSEFSGAALTHGFQIAFYALAAIAAAGAVVAAVMTESRAVTVASGERVEEHELALEAA
jgi:EmrB/QacA subfamily drug resistance transporter